MTPKLYKIINSLIKELEISITEKVTKKLRETYVDDIRSIIKDCLRSDELLKSTSSGEWITIQDASSKYKMSKRAIGNKCRLFKEGTYKIERKWVGKHNLINEKQFLLACEQKEGKVVPKFLKIRGKKSQ